MKAIFIIALGICTLTTFAQEQQNLIWAKQLGGKQLDKNVSTAIDQSGNFILTGTFGDTVDFDLGPNVFNLVSTGSTDIYVAKYNHQGNLIWAKQMSTGYTIPFINGEQVKHLTVDKNNQIYLTGTFLDSIDCDLGAGVAKVYNTAGLFISKLDSNGNFIWAKSIGNYNGQYALAIAVDDSLNVFLSGSFTNTVDFNPGPSINNLISGGSGHDIFILKLDALGNFIWVNQLAGSSDERIFSMKIDDSSNLIFFGLALGADFDFSPSSTFKIALSEQIFVLKINTQGVFKWAKGFAGISITNAPNTLEIGKDGDIFLAGNFYNTMDFDPGVGQYLMTATNWMSLTITDIFLMKLNSSGEFAWAKQFGGPNIEVISGIFADKMGNIYSTGFYQGKTDFDPGPGVFNLYENGSSDSYVFKLDRNGKFVFAVSIGGTLPDEGTAVFTDDSNYVYTIGLFNGTGDFDPGIGEYNLTSNGSQDIYIHKIGACKQPNLGIQTAGDSIYALETNASYQWFDCYFDMPIKGETKKHLKPRSSGKYAVQITKGSCTYKSACIEYKSPSSNLLETNTQTALNLYPNPANASVKIQTNQIMQRIQIKDLQGKTVLSEQVNDIHHEINTSEISNGIYMLETIGADGAISSNQRLCIVH